MTFAQTGQHSNRTAIVGLLGLVAVIIWTMVTYVTTYETTRLAIDARGMIRLGAFERCLYEVNRLRKEPISDYNFQTCKEQAMTTIPPEYLR